MRGLFETASQSKVQAEEGQRHYTSEGTKLVPNNTNAKRELLAYSMESGKPLNLSLDWTLSVCGTNPVDSDKGVENNWTRWFPRLHHHYHQLSIVSLLDALSVSRTLSGDT